MSERDDIIRLAKECGVSNGVSTDCWIASTSELAAFFHAAQKLEREACAKECDAVQARNEDNGQWLWEAKNCARAIRNRSKTNETK